MMDRPVEKAAMIVIPVFSVCFFPPSAYRMRLEPEDGTNLTIRCDVDDWHRLIRGRFWNSSELVPIIENLKHCEGAYHDH